MARVRKGGSEKKESTTIPEVYYPKCHLHDPSGSIILTNELNPFFRHEFIVCNSTGRMEPCGG